LIHCCGVQRIELGLDDGGWGGFPNPRRVSFDLHGRVSVAMQFDGGFIRDGIETPVSEEEGEVPRARWSLADREASHCRALSRHDDCSQTSIRGYSSRTLPAIKFSAGLAVNGAVLQPARSLPFIARRAPANSRVVSRSDTPVNERTPHDFCVLQRVSPGNFPHAAWRAH